LSPVRAKAGVPAREREKTVREAGELTLTVGRARERASPTDTAWRNLVSEGGELPENVRLASGSPPSETILFCCVPAGRDASHRRPAVILYSPASRAF